MQMSLKKQGSGVCVNVCVFEQKYLIEMNT